MKKIIAFLLTLISLAAEAEESRSARSAQRRPVLPGKEDVLNLSASSFFSGESGSAALSASYALSKKWNARLIAPGVPIYGQDGYDGNLIFDASRSFYFGKDHRVIFGVQNGTQLLSSSRSWEFAGYASAVFQVTDWMSVGGGLIYANSGMTGDGEHFGPTAGLKVTFNEDWSVIGSYYGTYAGSQVTANYKVSDSVTLALGAVIPTTADAEITGVIGLSYDIK